MLSGLTGWHFLILLVIVLLLFGATKLPALAKSVGQSMKIFRSEVKTGGDDPGATDSAPTGTKNNADSTESSSKP